LADYPGESWEYGRSTDVLGRVIEIASNKSLESFLDENIFSLLNMRDTGFYVERKNWNRIAEPFKDKEPSLINITKRPLLKGYDTLLRLSQIWNIRRKFYEEAADLTIETDRLSPIQVQSIIIKKLHSYYEIN